MTGIPFRSIARTLNSAIWRWATLCALVIALLQTGLSYYHVKQEFEDDLRQIGLTHVPLFSISIWDIEPQVVQWQVDNLAQRDTIGFVRLQAETGQVFVAGDARLGVEGGARTFEISPPGKAIGTVGILEVYANPRAVYREWLYGVGFALLGYGLLTVLIGAVVAYVLRRELEMPMNQVATFVRGLTPDRLTEPLRLNRPQHDGRDEIDLVVEGFQVLQDGIDRHISNLDELVGQRTRELELALESIRRMSQIDSLTGCFNRRYFNEQVMREVERAERYQRALSVVFCDIDHFKAINDTYGHLAGDEVLSAVSTVFQESLRTEIDWVARYGGEEFVLVLPETTIVDAVAVAERLRRQLAESLLVPVGAEMLRVTASFGVAQFASGQAVKCLLDAADRELYRAKDAGRNRVFPVLPD